MSQQDAAQIKERILTFLSVRGPSLPIHVSKEIDMSLLFASAFLSELLAERKVKITNMKVGSSSLHFIQGQEPRLEKFAEQFLKSKEKDAFLRLKERKFLKDSEQEPAIRVALRAIKDFALPFTSSKNELIWRYFLAKEADYEKSIQQDAPATKPKIIEEIKVVEIIEMPEQSTPMPEPKIIERINTGEKKQLDIFDKSEEKAEENEKVKENRIIEKQLEKPASPKQKKKPAKKKAASKTNEKFFNRVKEYTALKNLEILDIESFNKSELLLRVKKNEKEMLLVAYNKKRINEADIIKAYKKSSELKIPYTLLSMGDAPKKIESLLEALKTLNSVEKMD